MWWILTGSMAMCAGAVIEPDAYCEVAISYQVGQSNPEIMLDKEIAQWEIGYEKGQWTAFYQHTSGIITTEDGLGLNLIGFKYRF